MKKHTKCPKCSSTEVFIVPLNKNLYGGAIGKGILSAVNIRRYLCFGCGFTEEWIDDKKELEAIKAYAKDKGWKKKEF